MPGIYSGDKFEVVALLSFLNHANTHMYIYGSTDRGKKVKNVVEPKAETYNQAMSMVSE